MQLIYYGMEERNELQPRIGETKRGKKIMYESGLKQGWDKGHNFDGIV